MYGQKIDTTPGEIPASTFAGEDFSDLALSPSSTVIGFDDLTIYRIGGGDSFSLVHGFLKRKPNLLFFFLLIESIAPSSALPIGATRTVSELQPVPVDPAQKGSGLLNAVLALLAPPHPDENERYDEEVLDLDVIGFLVVSV